jgi:outer membrane protein assembly factor BamB
MLKIIFLISIFAHISSNCASFLFSLKPSLHFGEKIEEISFDSENFLFSTNNRVYFYKKDKKHVICESESKYPKKVAIFGNRIFFVDFVDHHFNLICKKNDDLSNVFVKKLDYFVMNTIFFKDDNLFLIDEKMYLYCYSKNGDSLWYSGVLNKNGNVFNAKMLVEDNIYILDNFTRFKVLDKRNGKKVFSSFFKENILDFSIFGGNVLFFGSGNVYYSDLNQLDSVSKFEKKKLEKNNKTINAGVYKADLKNFVFFENGSSYSVGLKIDNNVVVFEKYKFFNGAFIGYSSGKLFIIKNAELSVLDIKHSVSEFFYQNDVFVVKANRMVDEFFVYG